MSIIKAFNNAHKYKHERDWDTLYVLLDIHGTAMIPNWSGVSHEFYPLCLDVLRQLSSDPLYKIIMWTCSKEVDRNHYYILLKNAGVDIYAINENPDLDDTLDWGDYSKKPYCNILLEDKAGFDPLTDWKLIQEFLNNK